MAIKLLRKELKQQKHIASGKLYDGFYTRISEKGDSVVMAVMNNTPLCGLLMTENQGCKCFLSGNIRLGVKKTRQGRNKVCGYTRSKPICSKNKTQFRKKIFNKRWGKSCTSKIFLY